MIYLSNLVVGLEKGLDDIDFLLNAISPFVNDVGLEFFIHTYSDHYMKKLILINNWIGLIPRTTHGPFIKVEATSAPETEERKNLFRSYARSFEAAAKIGSEHLVFHSNECVVTPESKAFLQQCCLDNIAELVEMSEQFSITLLLENLALPCKGTPLFNEDEFIKLFEQFTEARCLIDVGHMYLARWNMERVISKLSSKIIGYHLHNNNGFTDSHQSISDGNFDYNNFFRIYQKYTPNADLTLEYGDNHGITLDNLHKDLNCLLGITKSAEKY